MADPIRTLTIRAKTEGVPESTRALNELERAHKGVADAAQKTATVTETTTRRGLSPAEAYRRQTLALDENARAQHRIAQAIKVADEALNRGVITQNEHAQRLTLIRDRYTAMGSSARRAGADIAQSTGLARHETVNLFRQVQDIGVSLSSGQSPLTVLVQQGTQVADIFATSTGSVRGFFTQAIGWAGRFVVSTAGVVTGIGAIAAASAFAAASWSSGQRDIERALAGVGRASGLTRDQINSIGEASSSAFGLSRSQAREAATAFAGTGRIYEENTKLATMALHDFARAAGVDVPEAQKMLTKALLDPAAGALELNKAIGFLDATTLNYIRTLQAQGRLQEAGRVLLDAMRERTGQMSANVGKLSQAWEFATNSIDKFWESWGRATARSAERLTGLNFGGFGDEERLAGARDRLSRLQASPFQGPLAQPGLKAAADEVARLEERMRALAQATEDARFAQFRLDADAATRALIPQIEQVEKLTGALSALERIQAARAGQGLAANPQLDAAANAARVQIALLLEAEQIEARRAIRVSEIALQYNNVSLSTAIVLSAQKDQLAIASAQTTQERLIAQEQANINALRLQGKSLVEATTIAVGQTAIAQAQLRVAAEDQLQALRDQYELIVASSDEERNRIAAAQTYKRIVEETGDSELARLTAQQQFVNAQERARRAAEETADASDRVARSSRNNAIAADAAADAYERWAEQMRAIEHAQRFVPFASSNLSGLYTSQLFTTQNGQLTQFNPAGYQSTGDAVLPANLAAAGMSGIDFATGTVNQQGLTNIIDKALQSGGGLMSAIDDVLKTGITQTSAGVLNQLVGLLPEEQREGALQKQLSAVSEQAPSLAREQLIRQLTDALDQLRQSTDGLSSTMQNILSPIYSQDPRTTHLGFRAGFADGGSFIVPGGRSDNDNMMVHMPVASGERVTVDRNPGQGGEPRIINNISINIRGNADRDTARETAFQVSQRVARAVRGAR